MAVTAGQIRRPPAEEALTLAIHRGWPEVEQALEAGRLRDAWEALLARDSAATFFQTPLWCATWYRCYQDEFEPLLLAAEARDRIVGLAPLAVQRATGRLVFAGEHMSDYRDFLCEDARRPDALALFLPYLLARSPDARLVIGHTQADSATSEAVRRWAAGQRRCRVIVRTHPCQRFRLQSPEDLRGLYRKKGIRQAVSFYRKIGRLEYRRVRDQHEWSQIKDAYFQQHSLRQAFAGRPLAFQDPRKRTFYSQLFESRSPEIHFSGLWLAERPISFMFCVAFRGVLYYGAPSVDPVEQKRSPGLLHLLEAMTDCQRTGFREMDFTMGDSAFKGRLANDCVDLPTVYLYGRLQPFWLDLTRKTGADWAKGLLARAGWSDQTWTSVKATAVRAWTRWKQRSRLEPLRPLRLASRRLLALAYDRFTGEIFHLRPGELRRVSPVLLPGEACEFRRNRLEDFLALTGGDDGRISALVRTAVERINQGHTLHTVLVDGRLAHFGWAYQPTEPLTLPETRTRVPLPAGALSLYDFFTAEAYRGRRLYPANLTQIAAAAFERRVPAVYIVAERRNVASRRAIERVGFQRAAVHRRTRVLGLHWNRIEEERRAVGGPGLAA